MKSQLPQQRDVPPHLSSLSEMVISEVGRGDIPHWLFPNLMIEIIAIIKRFYLASKRGVTRVERDLTYHSVHPEVLNHTIIFGLREREKNAQSC